MYHTPCDEMMMMMMIVHHAIAVQEKKKMLFDTPFCNIVLLYRASEASSFYHCFGIFLRREQAVHRISYTTTCMLRARGRMHTGEVMYLSVSYDIQDKK